MSITNQDTRLSRPDYSMIRSDSDSDSDSDSGSDHDVQEEKATVLGGVMFDCFKPREDPDRFVGTDLPKKVLKKHWKTIKKAWKAAQPAGFAELQKNRICGLMLDFDYKQVSPHVQVSEGEKRRLIEEVVKIINSTFDWRQAVGDSDDSDSDDDELFTPEIHIALAERPLQMNAAAVPGEARPILRTKGKYYGHGFHLLIPEIMADYETKRFLIHRICNEIDFKAIFGNCSLLDYSLIDMASAHVPVFIPGSSAPGKHQWHKITQVLKYDTAEGVQGLETVPIGKWNIPVEFSLNKWGLETKLTKVQYGLTDGAEVQYRAWKSAEKARMAAKEQKEDAFRPPEEVIERVQADTGTFMEGLASGLAGLSAEHRDETRSWKSVLSILKNLTATYKLPREQMLAIANEWSSRSPKYVSADDVERHWDMIRQPSGQMGLLVWMLRDNEPAQKRFRSWWQTTFPEKIDLTYYKRQASSVTTIEAYNKLCSGVVAYMNTQLCVIKGDKTYYIKTFDDYDQETGARRTGRQYKSYKCLMADYDNKRMKTKISKADLEKAGLTPKANNIDPLKLWHTSPARLEFDKMTMNPRLYRNLKDSGRATNIYNLYKGAGIEEDDLEERGIEVPEDFENHPFFEHIRKRWCGGRVDLYNAVLDRFAHIIQMPWIKMGSSLVLRGTERCGKGMILQIVAEILGTDYMFQPSSEDSIFGQFNEGMSNCLMLFLDEMVWGGDKKKAGVLKKLITEQYIYINRKHMPLEKVPNNTNIFMASNEKWVVPAGTTDQRYQVLDVAGELATMPRAKSKPIIKAIHSIDRQLLAKFFYERDVSQFDHRRIINTEALRYQKMQGMEPLRKWWHDCLVEGGVDVGGGDRIPVGEWIGKDRLYESYIEESKDRHTNKSQFAKDLGLIADVIGSKRGRQGNKRPRMVQTADLEACRDKWRSVYNDPDWKFPAIDVDSDADSSDSDSD